MKKRLKIGIYVALLAMLVGTIVFIHSQRDTRPVTYEVLPTSSIVPEPLYTDGLEGFSLSDVPSYNGEASVILHGNRPYFDAWRREPESFEYYSPLDNLGRCGVTCANIGQDLMPTEPREGIGMVKPTGWHTVRYDDLIDDKYLYNRCHLIGFQLTGENANTQNLITGTRYMNIQGMLPIENQVAKYIRETGNHVLYRSTPVFEGDNLLASGVLIEAWSLEDDGEALSLCRYAYNVQPGIVIDYATGESERE